MSINYNQKFYKEIFLNALTNAFNQGLISHEDQFLNYIKNKEDISNFYVMLLSIHSEVFEKVYEDMTLVYNSSKLLKANGSDLDDIGVILNCPRPDATKAGVELTFTLHKSFDYDITENAGIQVTTDNGIIYQTTEALYIPANTLEATVYAYAIEAGVNYKVIENSLTKIISKLSNIDVGISVTNNQASSGGSEVYTDDEYRELLSNWIKINQKGNLWAYRNYFSRVDGVEDYNLIPNWDGTGTIKIIIDPGSNYLLNKIYNELRENVIQIDDDIVLSAPVGKTIDISASVNVDIDLPVHYSSSDKEVISAKIISSIKDYINSLKIGEDFIPHKLAVYVDDKVSELKNISFTYPSSVVEVSDEEQCSPGDIEIIME